MKYKGILLATLIASVSLLMANQGQQPDPTVNVEAMKKISSMIGKWKGKGTYTTGPGQTESVDVNEEVQAKVGGTVLQIDGLGKSGEKVVHNAFGAVFYDPASKLYKIKAFIANGNNIETEFKVLGDGKYEWGFPAGPSGTVRFTITITATTWHEVGEFSPDGKNWYKTLDMTLERVMK